MWLLLEFLYLEWHPLPSSVKFVNENDVNIKFRIIRVIYFGFLGTTRIDLLDHPETDDDFWPKLWKTVKVFFTDLVSMIFLVWAFGRSIM